MKTRNFITCLFCLLMGSVQAQDVAGWLEAARGAFSDGDYRTTLANVTKIEEEVGSRTKPATAYLRIMSHYRLKEYEKCVSAAEAYLADSPTEDETLNEINQTVANARQQIKAAAEERQRQIRAAEEERQRIAEAARRKAAHEKEAADEWVRIQNSSDVAAFEAFLVKYRDTPLEATARKRFNDEKAWKDAKYAEDYEAYLRNHSVHAQQARDKLKEAYVRLGKEHADKNDLKKMEEMFGRYERMFSGSNSEITTVRCNAYTRQGDALLVNKSEYSQKQAIESYTKAQSYCTDKRSLNSKIKKASGRIHAINRPDYTYFGWTGDAQMPVGFTIGSLKQRKVGFYLTYRFNKAGFGEKATELPADMAYSWTSEPKDANMGFSVGLTKRLFYPLWIYIGGGVSQDNIIFQYGANEDDKWGYYPDDYKINPLGEGGLILKLWILHVSGGVRSNFKTYYPTIGAGFVF